MNRSRATAIAITGAIMIRMSTDMYHHCGPRVAFRAATVSGSVCALALVRNSAIRYSMVGALSALGAGGRRAPGRAVLRAPLPAAAPAETARGPSWHEGRRAS